MITPAPRFLTIGIPLALAVVAGVAWWKGYQADATDPRTERMIAGNAASAVTDRQLVPNAFASFDSWRERWSNAKPPEREALIATGVVAATARQRELGAILREDPARALRFVLPLEDLASLPDAVRAHCEQPLNAIGDIDLRWSTSVLDDGSLDCQQQQIAYANGKSWPTRLASRGDIRMPLSGTLLDGHVIDGELLLSPQPLRILSPEEVAAAGVFFPSGGALDPVTGDLPDDHTAAVLGGRLFRFESPESLQQVVGQLDSAVGEAARNRMRKLDHGLAWLEADDGEVLGRFSGNTELSPWLSDAVNVLFIRVDFSDFPGQPVTQADLQTDLSTVGGHLQNYSYGAASLTGTVTSQLYRMPATGTSYATSTAGSDDLIAAAKAAAAANYTLSNYNVVAVFFPNLSGVPGSAITYGGLASVGGSNHWINGLSTSSDRVSVMLHEFGHNYGLYHANYWDPSQGIAGSYGGPGASSLEYGDIFDRMGSATPANGYFSPYATNRLNWLSGAKIVQPSADGTWRVHRFDQPSATTNNTLALRVPLGGGKYFWVGHRKLYPSAPYNLNNAAYVVGEGFYTDRPNLIDMTPGSQTPESNDRNDSGLIVGSTYHDAASGTRLTTMVAGGTAPNEWIDVKVDFDPRIEIVSTQVSVNESAGNARITVRRSMDSSTACSVNYATAPGSAAAGTDYLSVSGTLSWAAGDATDKSILVPIRPDSAVEGVESFSLALSAPVSAVLAGSASATVQIHDAGQPMPEFAPPFFNSTVNAVVPLANGKVLVAGNLYEGLTGHIARLNADGSEDTSFTKGSGFNNIVYTLVVQSDGKILVGGDFTSYNGTACNRLVRLGSNGAVDTAFVTAMGSAADAAVRAIALEANGGILVGGDFASFNTVASEGLVRLQASGARNATALSLPYDATWNTSIRSLIVQEDGKIMTAGSLYLGWTGSGFRSGVARLNSNGANDASFNQDAGAHAAGGTHSLRSVETMIRLPNGKYLIGGQFTAYDENAAPQIARINTNGSFDATFTPPAFSNTVTTMLLQPTGNVVVGGWFNSPVGYLERLLPTGIADASFNQGTGPGGSVYTLARDASGAMWVGGNFFSYNGTSCRPIIKISSGLNAYDAWADSVFKQSQFTSGMAAADADADSDGSANIIELLVGTNPNSPNSDSIITQSLASVGPNNFLQASLSRSASVDGLWVMAQFSNNLGGWLPSPPVNGTNTVYDIIVNSPAQFTVRDKTASGTNPRRFVRFVVDVPR